MMTLLVARGFSKPCWLVTGRQALLPHVPRSAVLGCGKCGTTTAKQETSRKIRFRVFCSFILLPFLILEIPKELPIHPATQTTGPVSHHVIKWSTPQQALSDLSSYPGDPKDVQESMIQEPGPFSEGRPLCHQALRSERKRSSEEERPRRPPGEGRGLT